MRNPFRRREPEQEQRDLYGTSWPTWSEVSAGRATVIGASEQRALSLVPVFASCRLIAGTISTLPLKTYRDVDGEKRQVVQAQLFRTLEESGQLVPWLHACLTSLLLRGNAIGEIVARDGYAFPTQIEWVNPSGVFYDASDLDRRGWRIGNRLVPERDVVHIAKFTLPGRREGLSPIAAFASTINGGLETIKYGADWFANGGFPPGTFQNTQKTVPQPEADTIKLRLHNAIRSRQPLVYGNDWKYEPVTVPPGEAQFVETLRMNATQVAGIFGIPPEMIGGETGRSNTYQNVEQQQIQFLQMTLRPWLVTLEHAFSSILPERQYVRFNADALIRPDTKTRHEVYEISRKIGLRSTDELRALEELPSLPGGTGADYTPLGANLTPPDQPTSGSAGPRAGEGPADNVRSITWHRPA